jgi:hypothetical protein
MIKLRYRQPQPLPCHSERSEESAFSSDRDEKQIPRAKNALGMTSSKVFAEMGRL